MECNICGHKEIEDGICLACGALVIVEEPKKVGSVTMKEQIPGVQQTPGQKLLTEVC